MSDQVEPVTDAGVRRRRPRVLIAAAVLVALVVGGWAMSQSSAPAACRDAAESRWASGGSWARVTFDEKGADGWSVKGVIERGPSSALVVERYWECVDGSITWSSPAG